MNIFFRNSLIKEKYLKLTSSFLRVDNAVVILSSTLSCFMVNTELINIISVTIFPLSQNKIK